jgi:hypothetical protein
MNAPEQPIGWPSAIAPPFALTFFHVELEAARHRDRLRREGLVALDHVDLVERQPGLLQRQLRGRESGPRP